MRRIGVLAALVLSTAAVGVAAAPEFAIAGGMSSRSMATIFVEPELRFASGLFGRESSLGLRAELPLLLAAAGPLDTGQLSIEGTQELLHRATASSARRTRASLIGRASVGLSYQNQVLGSFTSISSLLGLDLGIRFKMMRAGLLAMWSSSLATYWVPSSAVDATFAGSSITPTAGWLGPDTGRFLYGLSLEGDLTDNLTLGGELLGVFTPNPFVKGFDGMMFGQWPFSMRLFLRYVAGGSSRRS